MKCYNVGNRDIMEQDKKGGYYFRHVLALTAEALHSKSDIAAELAHRDIHIDLLTAAIDEIMPRYCEMFEAAGLGDSSASVAVKIAREAMAYKGEEI